MRLKVGRFRESARQLARGERFPSNHGERSAGPSAACTRLRCCCSEPSAAPLAPHRPQRRSALGLQPRPRSGLWRGGGSASCASSGGCHGGSGAPGGLAAGRRARSLRCGSGPASSAGCGSHVGNAGGGEVGGVGLDEDRAPAAKAGIGGVRGEGPAVDRNEVMGAAHSRIVGARSSSDTSSASPGPGPQGRGRESSAARATHGS